MFSTTSGSGRFRSRLNLYLTSPTPDSIDQINIILISGLNSAKDCCAELSSALATWIPEDNSSASAHIYFPLLQWTRSPLHPTSLARSLSATSPSLLHSFVSLLPPLFLSIPPSLTPSIHLCCAELFNQTQEYLKPFPIKTPSSFRNLGGTNFLDLQKGLIHTASKDHRGKGGKVAVFFSSLPFLHFSNPSACVYF